MVKTTIFSLLFSFLYVSNLISAEQITIPQGNTISVDGRFSPGEWSDAADISLKLKAGPSIKVYFKHDAKNLYLAYCSNLLSTNNVRCPEVLLDINNDKSTAWLGDDWWFHVSGTDCYSKGKYGDYTTCKAVQPDWEANNMSDPGFMDTVEVIIPFKTMGVEPVGIVTLGMCFVGTDTQMEWEYWPAGADKSKPSGWADARIEFEPSGVDEKAAGSFIISPNPANNQINISDVEETSEICIYSTTGIKLIESCGDATIDISALPAGLYLVCISGVEGIKSKEFIVIR